MRDQKTKQINFRVTPALNARFEEALKKQGHTKTDALIMLITQYCERSEKSKKFFENPQNPLDNV